MGASRLEKSYIKFITKQKLSLWVVLNYFQIQECLGPTTLVLPVIVRPWDACNQQCGLYQEMTVALSATTALAHFRLKLMWQTLRCSASMMPSKICSLVNHILSGGTCPATCQVAKLLL